MRLLNITVSKLSNCTSNNIEVTLEYLRYTIKTIGPVVRNLFHLSRAVCTVGTGDITDRLHFITEDMSYILNKKHFQLCNGGDFRFRLFQIN